MAKQAIIDVIEDVIGEYVLDLSKDSLRTNMVRGRITLENVQLDGDLIGSHVLGKLGLSGFGPKYSSTPLDRRPESTAFCRRICLVAPASCPGSPRT